MRMIGLICQSQPLFHIKSIIHYGIAGARASTSNGFATPVVTPLLTLCCSRKGAGDKKPPALISAVVTPKPKIICIHCKKKMDKNDPGFKSYRDLKDHFKDKEAHEDYQHKKHHWDVWCPECWNGLKKIADHGCPETVTKREEWEKAEKERVEKEKEMGKKKKKNRGK